MTRVRVEGSFVMLDFQGDLKDAIQIKAINKSSHPVRVDSVGIELHDDSGRTAQPIQHYPQATIPGVVASHMGGETWVLLEGTLGDTAVLDLTEPVRVFVTVANKSDRIYSKPRRYWAKEDED